MSAIILGILSNFWPYILAAFGGLALILQQRRAGAKAERTKQAEREREAQEIARQIDGDIGAMPPAEAREQLKRWSR